MLLNLKSALAADIAAGLAAAQAAGSLPSLEKVPPIVVERPEHTERGDYASPIALALTKQLKVAPLKIVEAIAEHMPKKEYIGKLESAAPGFLNIRLSPGWLVARLDDVIEQSLCDASVGAGKHINVEFISANPTGPLTLGNARTAFSVDTLANVLLCLGFSVTREYYINDAGNQIRRLGQSVLRRILQTQGKDLPYDEEFYQGDYIKDIAAMLAEELRENEGKECTEEDEKNMATVDQLGQRAAALLLGDIRQMVEEDMGIRFDVWTSEQAIRASGIIEKTLGELRERRATYQKDGVEYLKTTDFGDSEDRVLVKSDGEYAYIAPDIGYHQDKYNRGFDAMYTYVGADHQGHGPKLMAAMKALGNDPSKLHVVAAQWMRIVRGGKPVKLSKRAGNIYTPRELIGEVGRDAVRFFMVQHALTTHMDFDLDVASEQSERNPVYYVQYAYVRLQSIMRRAKQEGVIASLGDRIELTSRSALTHTAELALLQQIYRLPEVLGDIATSFEIQSLAYYAHDLARSIHSFYKHVPVLAADDLEIKRGRLQLVIAARKVLGQTLDLLGLSKPDVM